MVFSSVVQQEQLKSHREGKKLDLNAPLISVRRHHQLETTASSSEDEQVQQQQNSSNAYLHHADEAGKEDDEEGASWGSLRSPGAVPFVWERTPGRPKFDSSSHNDTALVSCSSPSLPPGRATTWTAASPARPAQPARPVSLTDPNNNASVADVKASQHRKKKLPLLLKESPHRKHKQSTLGVLLGTTTGAASSGSVSEHDEAAAQSESVMADPAAPARSANLTCDPSARDFILKRFLPAAKAMADESASSTPFSSPLVPTTYNNNHQQLNPRTPFTAASPSSSSPRKQVSASVERIQTYQYKFANGSKSHKSHEEFFGFKACGFFSLAAAFRHLRPHYPSSRLKRSSDRAHNRFAAADDFRTSILVKKVNGGLTIKHEEEFSETETEDDPRPQRNQTRNREGSKLNSPNGRQNSPRMFFSSSPRNQERFYDCDANQEAFDLKKPKTPGRTYYRGCMSPFPEKAADAKGFLGLPENYKPPDDPYMNGGYSPSVHHKQRGEAEKDRNLPSMMSIRNESSLAQKLGKTLRLDTDNVGSSPSPGYRNAAVSTESLRYHQEYQPGRTSSAYQSDLEKLPSPSPSPGRSNAPVSSLLPPKSPSQSWLWKSVPLSPSTKSQAKNANWEATVKSRRLRPGHLRYSEENAFQPYV